MNKRYVAIWFMHLKTDWMIRQDPQLKDISFALAYPDHGRMRITEPGAVAKSNGIEPGIVVADAKILLPDLHIIEDKPLLSKEILKKIGNWCIRYTPAPSIDLPEGLMLDVTGCSHLWQGDDAYLKDITTKLEAFGYHIRAAMADTIGAAWAVSRFGKGNAIIGHEKQRQALLSLSPAALRLEISTVQRLYKLGLYTIGSFADMKPSTLRRRFGTRVSERLEQALGISEEFIDPLFPVSHYDERLPCLEPIQSRKGIEIPLEKLLEKITKRLRKEGKGIRSAVFKGFRTDGKVEEIAITTSRPSADSKHLFRLFEIKLEQIAPGMGIELFLLTATHVQELTPIQRSLWDFSEGFQGDELSRFVDKIRNKFGYESVCRYLPAEHHMPERSFTPSASLSEKPSVGWPSKRRRPVYLLSPPEKILVTAPIPDYPPMNFKYRGQLHSVRKADGPERIEPEWWIETGRHRDYYVVEDDEGKRYWLFRSGHYHEKNSPEWFLHGFFE